MEQITIKVNKDLLDRVRVQANKQGRSISSMFRELLIEYISTQE